MNKQEFTTTIRLETVIGEAQQELNKFSSLLQSTWRGGTPPKKFLKELESLKLNLASLQEIAGKDVVNSADLQRAESDYRAFSKSVHNLSVDFKLLSTEQKKSMLGSEEQANLKARTAALDKYTQAVERNREAEKQRKPLQTEKTELETKRSQLQTNRSGLEKRLSNLKNAGGPVLSAKAQQFATNSQQAQQLNALITKAEKTVAQRTAAGDKATGDNRLTRAQKQLQELRAELNKLDLTTGKADYDKAFQDYELTLNNLNQELNSTQTELEETDAKLKIVDKALNNLAPVDTEEEFRKLKETLQQLGVEGVDGATDLKTLTEQVKRLESEALIGLDTQLDRAEESLDSLGERMKETGQEIAKGTENIKEQNEAFSEQQAFENRIKQFLGIQGAAMVMRKALQDAMRTIQELDAAMTEMAVVTDLEIGDYWERLPEFTDNANNLGVSIQNAYEATTLYLQQGLAMTEAQEISNQTLKMARIAGLDAADATDKMTAALRGFNMELNETSAQRVADVYSELAAITAADVSEISSAMTKTASIASSAGMEFETTAAFLSQIIETTRESAETAGTALKTVIARFQELKKDPADIGEVDGEIVDANQIETALRSVGVSLRDARGQFRELDDVFLELSERWSSLDTNTQRYIATIAAGSRQQSRFIAMMQDYGRTQELVTAANASAGASNEQFEKTMESMSAKLNKLKNAWHEFTMGILDSDLVKVGIDILTKLMEILNKATGSLNGVFNSISKIATVIGVFKLASKLFEAIKAPLMRGFKSIIVESYKTAKQATGEFARGSREQAEKETNKGGASNTNKKMDGYAKKEKEVAEESKKNWDSVSQGIQKTGTAITGLGIGISVVGGLLSSLGLEEIGEGFTQVGQAVTICGMALMILPPILNVLRSNPTILIVTVAAGALLTILISITKYLDSISAEGKLKQAQEAASAAADAADRAEEAYKNLNSTLKELSSQYDTLSELTRGTKEWNEAVLQINNSVLKLIDSYPELAQFVQGKEGVLTIDIDDGRVQQVLEDAQTSAIIAQNNSIVAKAAAQKTALGVQFGELEGVQKIANKRASDVFWTDVNTGLELGLGGAALTAIATGGVGALASGIVAAAGTIAGLGAGAIRGAITKEETKTDKKLQESLEKLATSVHEGTIGTDYNSIYNELRQMGILENEAAILAQEFSYNTEALADFAASTKAAEQQQLAAYAAIATSAQSLADTLGFSEQQLLQSSVLVDNDQIEKFYQDKLNEIQAEEFDAKNYTGDYKAELEAAIRAQYGGTAYLGKNGTIHYQKDGENAEITLTNEQMAAMIATQYATEKAATAIEHSDEAIQKMKTYFQHSIQKNQQVSAGEAYTQAEELINNLFNASEGGALTKDNVKNLKEALGLEGLDTEEWLKKLAGDKERFYQGSAELKAMWASLGADGQEAFGDFTIFAEQIVDSLMMADDALTKAGEAALGYMNSRQARSFEQKAKQVSDMADIAINGIVQDGGAVIIEATKTFMQSLEEFPEKQREIQDLINATDWTNVESLLALELQLKYQYDLNATAVEQYIDTIEAAAYATSGLSLVIDVYGDLWRANQKIAQSAARVTDMQWEYNNSLEEGGKRIKELATSLFSEFKKQGKWSAQSYETAKDNLSTVYAQGKVNYKVDLTDAVKLGAGGINVDQTKIQDWIDAKQITQEQADEWIQSLQEQYDNMIEATDSLRATADAMKEQYKQGEESYYELREMVKDTIVGLIEQQIELEQALVDGTQEANDKLLSKMQEQIDEQRRARENAKTEQNIADLEAKRSLLIASGASATDIMEIEKQLDDSKTDYQDTLIDQKLEDIQDANEKAIEQRQTQIKIAEQQLELYKASEKFQQDADKHLNELLNAEQKWQETVFGNKMAQFYTKALSEKEKESWAEKIGGQVAEASWWTKKETQNEYAATMSKIKDNLDTIRKFFWGEEDNQKTGQLSQFAQTMLDTADSKARTNSVSKLRSAGFSDSFINTLDTETAAKYVRFAEREGDADTIQAKEEQARAFGHTDITGKADYYQSLVDSGEDIEEARTYEQWLDTKIASGGDNIESARRFLQKINGTKNGLYNFTKGTGRYEQLKYYYDLIGSKALTELIEEEIKSGAIDNVTVSGLNAYGWYEGETDHLVANLNGTDYDIDFTHKSGQGVNDTIKNELNALAGKQLKSGTVAAYEGETYIYVGGNRNNWYPLQNGYGNFTKAYLKLLRKQPAFKTGGLADFTGPAWLDGTKTKPEIVLNQQDSANFLVLRDILSEILTGTALEDKHKTESNKGGDNYYDIEINVDSLGSDYEVEQLADKIRSMLYEDATYRNVNTLRL